MFGTPQEKSISETFVNFAIWHKSRVSYNPRFKTHIQLLIEDYERFTGICIDEPTMLYLLTLENIQKRGYSVIGIRCEMRLTGLDLEK